MSLQKWLYWRNALLLFVDLQLAKEGSMTSLIVVNKEELAEVIQEQIKVILDSFERNKLITKESTLDKLYTRKEAASYLKISLPTLNTWTKEGVIKSERVQGRVYYLHNELQGAVCKKAKK